MDHPRHDFQRDRLPPRLRRFERRRVKRQQILQALDRMKVANGIPSGLPEPRQLEMRGSSAIFEVPSTGRSATQPLDLVLARVDRSRTSSTLANGQCREPVCSAGLGCNVALILGEIVPAHRLLHGWRERKARRNGPQAFSLLLLPQL